jgi:alpha-beta hydrolase superfamily lysophospholipase
MMARWQWSPSVLAHGDGPSLAYQVIPSETPVRARVVLIHGHGEYAHRYRPAIEEWSDRGIAVATFDLRGHGDSEGVRGHVDRFQDYVDDVFRVMDRVEQEPGFDAGPTPVLFAHSLGGLIAIHAALQRPDRMLGLVLSSPFLGLTLPVSLVNRAAAAAVSRIFPTFKGPTGIRGSYRTHDAELARESDSDGRLVRVGTARFLAEARLAQSRALASAHRITRPVICVQGGDDRIASASTTRAFMDRVQAAGSKLEVLPDAGHEILNDLPRHELIPKFAAIVVSLADSERTSGACT